MFIERSKSLIVFTNFITGLSNTYASSLGPSTDHTPTTGGQFVYVDVRTWQTSANAIFVTGDTFTASSDVCAVRFFYYMTGKD